MITAIIENKELSKLIGMKKVMLTMMEQDTREKDREFHKLYLAELEKKIELLQEN